MARRKKTLKILFVADPLENFDPVAETTIYLMKEAQKRGHRIYHCQPKDLTARGVQIFPSFREVKVTRPGRPQWYQVGRPQTTNAKKFSAILLRKDPPFDQDYLHHLYLLELLSGEVYLMNHPMGVLVGNEKLLALPMKHWIPSTLVSASRDELRGFIQKQKKGTIVKPLNDAGGRGVFLIRNLKSDNCNVILESVTQGFTRHVVAQAYVPEAKKGDKRILLLGQEVLGAFTRIPAPGEHRANLHAGGRPKKAKTSRQDQALIGLISPLLERLGLDFVGLDLIGGKLIEVNVTSPMGLHELNKTAGGRSESKVLDFIEDKAG